MRVKIIIHFYSNIIRGIKFKKWYKCNKILKMILKPVDKLINRNKNAAS